MRKDGSPVKGGRYFNKGGKITPEDGAARKPQPQTSPPKSPPGVEKKNDPAKEKSQ